MWVTLLGSQLWNYVVEIASAQSRWGRSWLAVSHPAVSRKVRLRLSTVSFCWGVAAMVKWRWMPLSWQCWLNVCEVNSLPLSVRMVMICNHVYFPPCFEKVGICRRFLPFCEKVNLVLSVEVVDDGKEVVSSWIRRNICWSPEVCMY